MLEPQLPPNDFAVRLQARIALLEQQNAALQQEQAEQERVAELAKMSEELGQREREVQRSYRLLSVVAEIGKDLLGNPQVDSAIKTALRHLSPFAARKLVTTNLKRWNSPVSSPIKSR